MANNKAWKKELEGTALAEQIAKAAGWADLDKLEQAIEILLDADYHKQEGKPDALIWLRIMILCGLQIPKRCPVLHSLLATMGMVFEEQGEQ